MHRMQLMSSCWKTISANTPQVVLLRPQFTTLLSISARALLIVEGILALHFAELRPYFNLSIYLEAPDEVCFHHRKVRDITERGRSLDFIQWQYKNTVLPAARQYLLPSKRFANLVIDAERDLATVESTLYEAIVKKPFWPQENVKK